MAATHYANLVANTPITIDVTAEVGTSPCIARVVTDGLGASGVRAYITGDGTPPTIDAAGTSVLFGGPAYKNVQLTKSGGQYLVKLQATAAMWVCVEIYSAD